MAAVTSCENQELLSKFFNGDMVSVRASLLLVS